APLSHPLFPLSLYFPLSLSLSHPPFFSLSHFSFSYLLSLSLSLSLSSSLSLSHPPFSSVAHFSFSNLLSLPHSLSLSFPLTLSFALILSPPSLPELECAEGALQTYQHLICSVLLLFIILSEWKCNGDWQLSPTLFSS